MTRCYLDTNFLYSHLRDASEHTDTRVSDWRKQLLDELAGDNAVISALVIDELAYRLVLAWLREDGDRDPLGAFRSEPRQVMERVADRLHATWEAVERLALELQPTEHTVVSAAKRFMQQPGLQPRDAFHAAHAEVARCPVIISSDPAFQGLTPFRVIPPTRR